MHLEILTAFTYVTLSLQVKCVNAKSNPEFSTLIHTLLTSSFKHCEIISVRDEYFSNHPDLVDWMWTVDRPIYTMGLNDSRNILLTFPPTLRKASGQHYCLLMVITCKSEKTCMFSEGARFMRNLDSQGIIRLIRRAIVYIEEETIDTIRPPAKYISPESNLKTISKLSSRFRDLRIHLTFVREMVNMTEDVKWLLQRKGMSLNECIYQMLTWSLNWLPGGVSPLLFDVWSPSKGFWKGRNVIIHPKDSKPGGTTRYVVAGLKLLPFFRLEPNGDVTGFGAEVMKIMQRKFNMTPVIFEAEDKSYGRFLQNRWTGVVGYVSRKEADIGLGSIAYDFAQRSADITYSPPVFLLEGSIACEYPHPLPNWRAIIFPFMFYVWTCSVASIICVLVLYRVFVAVEFNIWKNHFKIELSQGESMYRSNWLLILGPIFQRSMDLRTMSTLSSFRLFYGIWLITTFLLSVSYCNILIGKFSVPEREAPIFTLNDLLESDKPWDIVFTVKNYFKNSVSHVEKNVLNLARERNNVGNKFGVLADNEAYKNFMNHTRGCLVVQRKRAKYVLNYFSKPIGNGFRKPPIRLSREKFYLGPAGWALRGDMDFTILYSLTRSVNSYREVGILTKIEQTYAPRPSTFKGEELSIRKPLSLDVVGVTFLILLFGYLASIVAFCLEHLKIYIDRQLKIRKLKHVVLHYCE